MNVVQTSTEITVVVTLKAQDIVVTESDFAIEIIDPDRKSVLKRAADITFTNFLCPVLTSTIATDGHVTFTFTTGTIEGLYRVNLLKDNTTNTQKIDSIFFKVVNILTNFTHTISRIEA